MVMNDHCFGPEMAVDSVRFMMSLMQEELGTTLLIRSDPAVSPPPLAPHFIPEPCFKASFCSCSEEKSRSTDSKLCFLFFLVFFEFFFNVFFFTENGLAVDFSCFAALLFLAILCGGLTTWSSLDSTAHVHLCTICYAPASRRLCP